MVGQLRGDDALGVERRDDGVTAVDHLREMPRNGYRRGPGGPCDIHTLASQAGQVYVPPMPESPGCHVAAIGPPAQ
jgi:hypothetical protein